MPAENRKFATDCFQILYLDILQLCNVMLLENTLQENDFFIVCTHKRMAVFHVYMTTSVSAYDIIQITFVTQNGRSLCINLVYDVCMYD